MSATANHDVNAILSSAANSNATSTTQRTTRANDIVVDLDASDRRASVTTTALDYLSAMGCKDVDSTYHLSGMAGIDDMWQRLLTPDRHGNTAAGALLDAINNRVTASELRKAVSYFNRVMNPRHVFDDDMIAAARVQHAADRDGKVVNILDTRRAYNREISAHRDGNPNALAFYAIVILETLNPATSLARLGELETAMKLWQSGNTANQTEARFMTVERATSEMRASALDASRQRYDAWRASRLASSSAPALPAASEAPAVESDSTATSAPVPAPASKPASKIAAK